MPVTVRSGDILFNNGTTQSTAATGTVSSVATGNGLQGGTITTSGTLSIAAPGANTVGSYSVASVSGFNIAYNYSQGSNITAGGGVSCSQIFNYDAGDNGGAMSGTWRVMGSGGIVGANSPGVFRTLICRVS